MFAASFDPGIVVLVVAATAFGLVALVCGRVKEQPQPDPSGPKTRVWVMVISSNEQLKETYGAHDGYWDYPEWSRVYELAKKGRTFSAPLDDVTEYFVPTSRVEQWVSLWRKTYCRKNTWALIYDDKCVILPASLPFVRKPAQW